MRKNTVRGDALILTVSDQIEQLEYILENLPDICFHIAAPVVFSDRMLYNKVKNIKIIKFKNFSIYKLLKKWRLQWYKKFCYMRIVWQVKNIYLNQTT